MSQVLLRLDEMHLSRAAGVLFSTVASTRSTVGRKGTWSQHLPPIFRLCSKAECTSGVWQHQGTCLAALHEHLPMAVW